TEYTSTRYTVGLTSLFFFMSEAALDGDKVLEIFMDELPKRSLICLSSRKASTNFSLFLRKR
ncbi:MAG: hypothetical protein IJ988_05655, partial [Firmicutes bacterium]|nr:hypothetical protein [Bacillota bacterium]